MQVLGSISISKPCRCCSCCCCSCCFSPQLGDAKELLSLVGVLVEEEEKLFKRGVEVLWEERPGPEEVVALVAEAAPESECLLSSAWIPCGLED